MVTIAELRHAPGKSMRAQGDVPALYIDKRGLFGDREYMWVEGAAHLNVNHKPGTKAGPGRFISQREDPVLTGITVELVRGLFPLRRPVRLVAISDEVPKYVEDDPALGRVGFSDGYPVTVGSTAAFERINSYLVSIGRPAVATDRTRTTIILDGLDVGDDHFFPEDYVGAITITTEAGPLVLERRKACGRCPIPDTDQLTGERKTHVRSALGKLGRTGTHLDTVRYGSETEIFLTQNFIMRLRSDMTDNAPLKIERGCELEVTYTAHTNWVPTTRA